MDGGLNRLVSVRLWNTENNENQETDRAFYGWVSSDVNNDNFERLRVHLIFCPDNDVQEMVSELISEVKRGVDDIVFEQTKMGVFVEKVGFKIIEAKSIMNSITESLSRDNLNVIFDEINNENNESSTEDSQDSFDLDSMDSASMYYTERLRDYFDGF